MASQPIQGSSTESYEDAVRKIADQLRQGFPDELIEFTVTALRYKEGSIVGFPPTFIAEASTGAAAADGGYE